MKTVPVLFGLIVLAAGTNCRDSSANNNIQNNAAKGFAVIELFTSEGCSSCPPADNAVADLVKKNNSNVYVLSYHVDYWDHLGWKDMFSNAAYTQIQRGYAKAFKLASVYTPQIIVNGTAQFVGSDKNKLIAIVNSNLQHPAGIALSIDAKANDNHVTVNYKTDATNADIHVALVQLFANNIIQRGENTGATLHHVNIVRDIKTTTVAANGNIELVIPDGLLPKDCRVVAFTQNTVDNKITAAGEVSIH